MHRTVSLVRHLTTTLSDDHGGGGVIGGVRFVFVLFAARVTAFFVLLYM